MYLWMIAHSQTLRVSPWGTEARRAVIVRPPAWQSATSSSFDCEALPNFGSLESSGSPLNESWDR
jgi:hypothetical protein